MPPAGITPGFGFPVRKSGSVSWLSELGQDQRMAGAQASGFQGVHFTQLSGTLSLAAEFHPCRTYSGFQQHTNLKYFQDVFDFETSPKFTM